MARPRAAMNRVIYVGRPHGKRFRNLYFVVTKECPAGERQLDSFDTPAAAKYAAAKFVRDMGDSESLTVEAGIESFLKHMEVMRWRAGGNTRKTAEHRLGVFFDGVKDLPMTSLSTAHIVSARNRLISETYSAKYINECVKLAKSLCKWSVAHGHRRADPSEGIEFLRHENAGKPKLTLTETCKLREVVEPAARAGDVTAIGVLVLLCMGCRSAELVRLRVCDVDGPYLRLWDVKKNREAPQRIPALLAPMLEILTAERAAEDPLFGVSGSKWAPRIVRAWCKRAGVSVITSQGMRGTHDSLALEVGIVPQMVADATGHSPAIMDRHYAAPGSAASGRTVRVLSVLDGGASKVLTRPELADSSGNGTALNGFQAANS